MEMTNAVQTMIFLRAIVLGVICGLWYDGCRAVRHTAQAGAGLTALLDAVFWAAVLGLLFGFSVVHAEGTARSYVLAGIVLGGGMYVEVLSPSVLSAFKWVLGKMVQCVSFVVHKTEKFDLWLNGLHYTDRKMKKSEKNFKKTLPFFRKKG